MGNMEISVSDNITLDTKDEKATNERLLAYTNKIKNQFNNSDEKEED